MSLVRLAHLGHRRVEFLFDDGGLGRGRPLSAAIVLPGRGLLTTVSTLATLSVTAPEVKGVNRQAYPGATVRSRLLRLALARRAASGVG